MVSVEMGTSPSTAVAAMTRHTHLLQFAGQVASARADARMSAQFASDVTEHPQFPPVVGV
jgi:hypothetical protein